MADEFDFSELRNYLSGQIDLGEAELLLDEPWTLTRKPAVPGAPAAPRPIAPSHVPPTPAAAPAARPVPRNLPPQFPNSSAPAAGSAQAPIPDTTGFAPSLFGAVDSKATAIPAANMPTARTVKRAAHAFESVDSLDAFYESIKGEAMYAKEAALARYVGPAKPKLLFLLPAIKMAEAASISATSTDVFFGTPVGEMLSRLFASLSIEQKDIGITYFFKSTERPLAPLLELCKRSESSVVPTLQALIGRSITQELDIDGHAEGNLNDISYKMELDNRPGKKIDGNPTLSISDLEYPNNMGEKWSDDWEYLTIGAKSSTSFGTGISLTYKYKSNFSWRLFCDYDYTRKDFTATYDPFHFIEKGVTSGAYVFMETMGDYDDGEGLSVREYRTKKKMNYVTLGLSFMVNF